MRDKDIMRTVISIVLAFFIFVTLTLAVAAAGAGATIFSTRHFDKSFKESIYAEKNFDSLISALQDEAEAHSMPETLLSDQLEYDEFRQVLDENITKAAEGEEISEDAADAFAAETEQTIDDYFKENGVGVNSYIDDAVSEITDNAAGYYSNYTTMPFAGYFASQREAAMRIIKVLVPVCVMLTLIAAAVIIKLYDRRRPRKFYISSGVGAAGIAVVIAGLALSRSTGFTFAKELAGYDSFIEGFYGGATPVFWIAGIVLVIAAMIIKYEKDK